MANEKLIELLAESEHMSYEKKADFLIANDVVQVVRCKDCKHWKKSWIEGVSRGRCVGGIPRKSLPDDFCSYGERNDNE